MRTSDVCTLCAELEKNSSMSLFHRLFQGNLDNRILRETTNFVVIPTIGPLVAGHLLIVSKGHFLSIGHLRNDMYQELESLVAETREVLRVTISAPIFFEHGPVAENKTAGACVDHAHIHAVPVSLDARNSLKESLEEHKIDLLSELQTQVSREVAYIFYQDVNGRRYVYDVDRPFPCQFMRRWIASKIGLDGNLWDWHLYPSKQAMLDTLRRFEIWPKVDDAR